MEARQTSVTSDGYAAGGRTPGLGTRAERPSQRQPPEPSFLVPEGNLYEQPGGRRSMKVAQTSSFVLVWHGQVDQVCRTSPLFVLRTNPVGFSCKADAYLDVLRAPIVSVSLQKCVCIRSIHLCV